MFRISIDVDELIHDFAEFYELIDETLKLYKDDFNFNYIDSDIGDRSILS